MSYGLQKNGVPLKILRALACSRTSMTQSNILEKIEDPESESMITKDVIKAHIHTFVRKNFVVRSERAHECASCGHGNFLYSLTDDGRREVALHA